MGETRFIVKFKENGEILKTTIVQKNEAKLEQIQVRMLLILIFIPWVEIHCRAGTRYSEERERDQGTDSGLPEENKDRENSLA